jgi:hypothetical protein
MKQEGVKHFQSTLIPLIFLFGCQGTKSESQSTSTNDARSANSCFALVNGQLDVNGDYNAVVPLKNGRSLCTGTFVSDNTLLTAAHCVTPSAPGGGLKTLINGRVVVPLKALLSPMPDGKEREPKDDVAVIVFEDGTSDTWFELSRFPPKIGQRVTIVGFGQTDFVGDNRSDEKRRYGENTISDLPDKGATIKYELTVNNDGNAIGSDVMTGRGDSGGPLFLGNGLLGIVSRGEGKINKGKLIEYDANLVTFEMEKFLRSTLKSGAKINGLELLGKAASMTSGGFGACM